MNLDLVIQGGTLVTPAESFNADLGIRDGRIAAIGQDLSAPEMIDATGLLVLPGAIDPHVHLEMPVGVTASSDDFVTGSIAAACGGVTTFIDFVEPGPNQPLTTALAERRAAAEGRAVTDFALHMTLLNASPQTLAEIPAVVAAGSTSFKGYTTYDGFRLSDAEFLALMPAVRDAGGLMIVHAENDAIVQAMRTQLVAAGQLGPSAHPRSRPAVAEAEAVERILALAEVSAAPTYIVHISTARGAQAVARARRRGQAAFGETCPQYLVLTEAEYNRPGFEGAKFVCSPPLRTPADQNGLWRALAQGDVQTVGTDHCPFFYAGQKELGREIFTAIPGGIPGIEARLALLHTFGVRQGRISLQRWVQVCSTGPARMFGLYPRKGTLVPGADADVVLFDPNKQLTLSHSILHENVDYTPYEGLHLTGYPVFTLRRGEVLMREGEYVGQTAGQYLARRPFQN